MAISWIYRKFSVKFTHSLVPVNFLSLSVALNKSQIMAFTPTPSSGSSFGGYLITFSGVALSAVGDLTCRVGQMLSTLLTIGFSQVVCPVASSIGLSKSADLLLSDGTPISSLEFLRFYGLQRGP